MPIITRYSIKNKILKPWIKFIWYFKAENAKINHKLLPTDCIDLIINLSEAIIYETEYARILAPKMHINGLRNKFCNIHQTGDICVLGISFYSFGLFPFIYKSLEQIQDKIVDLNSLSILLEQKLNDVLSRKITNETINEIENILCSELKITDDYVKKAKIIHEYMELDEKVSIKSFCKELEINIKTFERMFLYYCGYTPKILKRIKRFQTASNQLVYETPDKLIDAAYDNDFTDQAHFIKEFNRFSGESPHSFLYKKDSIKQNIKYNYM